MSEANLTQKPEGVVLQGRQGASHYYSEEEKSAFVEYVNDQLKDEGLTDIPLSDAGDDLFVKMESGVVLNKLLSKSVPSSVDERKINMKATLSKFEKGENLEFFLANAAATGMKIVNIGANDVMEHKPHLILGLIWQIIKLGLFHKVLQNHPEMVVLLKPGEDTSTWDRLNQEELVLRWVNHHLARQKLEPITNLGSDLKDGRALCGLFRALEYAGKPLLPDLGQALHQPPAGRATLVLQFYFRTQHEVLM